MHIADRKRKSCEERNVIKLAQDRDKWRDFVDVRV
jgi:hypothetical protein